MFRALPYTLLLIALALLQVFIFDRALLFSTMLPVVYITFIILLPMQSTQLEMIFWGVAVGVLFDLLMGMVGVNTIATLFVSYVRGSILTRTVGQEIVALGVAPTPRAISDRRFIRYSAAMVLLHSAILFLVEALSLESPIFLLSRIILSSAVTLLVVRLIAGRFEQLISRNI